MAVWMKAELMPMLADLSRMRGATAQISERIFTVELYAGLVEELTQIQDGKPADNDAPIHLFQRRHYMDEECLVNYRAGGMRFANISEFDAWLLEPENKTRVLPKDRCVVAFKVRRRQREYTGDGGFADFISFHMEAKADELTFLYIRNGEQVFRMSTEIKFDAQLFPDIDHDLLFNNQAAWIYKPGHADEPVTQRQYEHLWSEYRRERSIAATKAWAWKRAGKPKRSWLLDDRYFEKLEALDPDHVKRVRSGDYGRSEHANPLQFPFGGTPAKPDLAPLTKDSVYYDDAMAKIERAAKDHNRIAVVLQGLLDRSVAFHPHPPWRLWTSEGFMLAIKLVHDDSRALVSGEAPNFEEYRKQLNKTLKVGSITVGQGGAWMRAEAEKHNARTKYDARKRTFYRPSGNPGPGHLASIKALRAGAATYTWVRSKKSDRSWRSGAYPTKFRCPVSQLLNVSAYTRGDYRIFYNDPRTRASYLQWAPLLLAAEDYACGYVEADGADRWAIDHTKEDARSEQAEAEAEAKKQQEKAMIDDEEEEEEEDEDDDEDEGDEDDVDDDVDDDDDDDDDDDNDEEDAP
jgi:hypothetical protein